MSRVNCCAVAVDDADSFSVVVSLHETKFEEADEDDDVRSRSDGSSRPGVRTSCNDEAPEGAGIGTLSPAGAKR